VPAVVLVADLREAGSPNDGCAQIIQVVREARGRGISVMELMPDSDSVVLKNHRVVVAPTVLILDKNGQELSRFEGESVASQQKSFRAEVSMRCRPSSSLGWWRV
jgi:hypothetical protein